MKVNLHENETYSIWKRLLIYEHICIFYSKYEYMSNVWNFAMLCFGTWALRIICFMPKSFLLDLKRKFINIPDGYGYSSAITVVLVTERAHNTVPVISKHYLQQTAMSCGRLIVVDIWLSQFMVDWTTAFCRNLKCLWAVLRYLWSVFWNQLFSGLTSC